jgi:choline dehydrogenase
MKYDTIIVGAGSAGAILATRLTEDPKRSVILLEAGPDYQDFEHLPEELKYGYGTALQAIGGIHDWNFFAKATDKAPPMPVPRGKVTGGSSAINMQAFLRGLPEDFDTWASWGNDQWSFDKVLPYFRKLETDADFHDDFHGTDGPIICRRFKRAEWFPYQLAFYNACLAAGFPDCPDMNHPNATGVGPVPMNNPNRIRLSTALGYLSQARHRLNLTIRPRCMAHRILFEGARATGVEVESGSEKFVVEGEEIILSAGAIGSPHLLMLSGIGPVRQLANLEIPVLTDLPGVGQNLRDHPSVALEWRAKEELPMDASDVSYQLALRSTAQGSNLRGDLFIIMHSNAAQHIIRMVLGLYLAKGSGELKLTSTDPSVQPALDYNYLQEPFDRQRLKEGIRLALKISEHEDFKTIIGERIQPSDADLHSDAALEDWMLRKVHTFSHISCTCKMGPASDEMAVVDQYGRVHGLEGLRIVDASIMPDCVRANINATTMMIGERVSDFIRQGL